MFSFLFADTKAVNYQEGDTDVESEQEEKEKPPNKKKKQDVKSNTQNNKKNNKNKQTDNRSKNKRTISSGSDSESEFQTVSKKRKIAKEKKSDDKNPEWKNEVENQNISTSLGNKRPRYAKDGLKLEEKEQLRKSKKQNLDKTKTSDDTDPKKKVECTSDIIIRKSDSIDRIVRSARRRKRDENDDVSVISYEYCY